MANVEQSGGREEEGDVISDSTSDAELHDRSLRTAFKVLGIWAVTFGLGGCMFFFTSLPMIGDGDTATRSEVNEWQARQAEMERAMEQSVLESKSDDESVVTNIEN